MWALGLMLPMRFELAWHIMVLRVLALGLVHVRAVGF